MISDIEVTTHQNASGVCTSYTVKKNSDKRVSESLENF